MSETLRTAFLFLINTLFDLYLFILIVRLVLVWTRANYFNPLVQFITKCTDFLVKPLRRIIPNAGRLESSSLLLLFLIAIIKYMLILLITYGMPNFVGIIVLALGNLVKLTVDTFFYAILIQAIISWVQPYSTINAILSQLTAPILYPFQRLIPPIGGIDISPIPALIILQLLSIVIANPISRIGFILAVG